MARAGLGAGWNCLFANDFDSMKVATYKANWGSEHIVCEDVAKLSASQLPGRVDLAWASFPCQDLSLAGDYAGLGRAASAELTRSGTFWPFWSLMKALKKEQRPPETDRPGERLRRPDFERRTGLRRDWRSSVGLRVQIWRARRRRKSLCPAKPSARFYYRGRKRDRRSPRSGRRRPLRRMASEGADVGARSSFPDRQKEVAVVAPPHSCRAYRVLFRPRRRSSGRRQMAHAGRDEPLDRHDVAGQQSEARERKASPAADCGSDLQTNPARPRRHEAATGRGSVRRDCGLPPNPAGRLEPANDNRRSWRQGAVAAAFVAGGRPSHGPRRRISTARAL